MITSPQNERVKLVHALLTQSKTRRKEGKVVLEGIRLIRDAMKSGFAPEFILYDPTAVSLDVLRSAVDPQSFLPISSDLVSRVSDTEEPQGIVGVFPLPSLPIPEKPNRVLILDTIRDPGNLGTILRTAAAAGVEAVLLTPGCVDVWNPKVLRGGMGAHFRLPMVKADWDAIRAHCEGLAIYIAISSGATEYQAVDWRAPWALIIGNEAHGESDEARGIATHRVRIPMAGDTESLNAAIATGIMLFEAYRQWR